MLLLLAALPLGVAGQNIAAALSALVLLGQLVRKIRLRSQEEHSQGGQRWFASKIGISTLLAAGLVFWITIAGLLNPGYPQPGLAGLPNGYLLWIFLPALVAAVCRPLSAANWQRLEQCVAVMALLLGIVATSQYIWGWKLDDGQFVAAPHRAQGFYSHPLTFAYVALLLLPLGAARWVQNPRSSAAWACFAGSMMAVLASQSRTVQLVAVLIVALNIFMRSRGASRLWLAAFGLAGLLVIGATDNPIQKKIVATLQGGYDVRSDYPDDRLAFWHAHWEMFKERPLVGHGENLNDAYRAPYYARIGLADFERQYEAHNMFLQVLINGGLIALMLFVAWWGVWLHFAWRHSRIGFETLLVFMLAAMTQNAFQDAEVRYGLTLVIAALALAMPLPAPAAKS